MRQAQKLTPETAEDLVVQYKFPYSYLRKHLQTMSTKVKAHVASYEVVWNGDACSQENSA